MIWIMARQFVAAASRSCAIDATSSSTFCMKTADAEPGRGGQFSASFAR
ncbi:MAG: hypothetical protein J2P15_10485 [Micromonosporaceae bacterium]|nr:hypothetical protein [Micromonosporaceae bacterium]